VRRFESEFAVDPVLEVIERLDHHLVQARRLSKTPQLFEERRGGPQLTKRRSRLSFIDEVNGERDPLTEVLSQRESPKSEARMSQGVEMFKPEPTEELTARSQERDQRVATHRSSP